MCELKNNDNVWVKGNLMRNPTYHEFPDGNKVVYLTLVCDAGQGRMVKIQCCARDKKRDWCHAHDLKSGDALMVMGYAHEKRDAMERSFIINVTDLATDLCSAWEQL